jgi:hypothetical protein
MSDKVQPTHINAYYTELDEAEQALLLARGRVSSLKRQIDERRAEEGLEPLYADQSDPDAEPDSKPSKSSKKDDSKPDEANGFGSRTESGKK